MKREIAEYAAVPRDTKRERALTQRLRQLPEEERFKLIWECLQSHTSLGLRLATACLQKPDYFQQILEYGLQRADASTIRCWLECVVPKLGFRRIISVLTQTLETNPRAVEKTLYWLPLFLPRDDERAVEAWTSLRMKAEPQELATALA